MFYDTLQFYSVPNPSALVRLPHIYCYNLFYNFSYCSYQNIISCRKYKIILRCVILYLTIPTSEAITGKLSAAFQRSASSNSSKGWKRPFLTAVVIFTSCCCCFFVFANSPSSPLLPYPPSSPIPLSILK